MKRLLIVLLSLTMLLGGCAKAPLTRTELESLPLEVSQYEFLTDENPNFIETSLYEVWKLIDEKGTGVVFLGYPTCYWCNRAIPAMNQAAKDNDYMVYYVNIMNYIQKEDIDGLTERIKSILVEEDGEYPIYVPLVLAIKDGEIMGSHVALVSSYDETKQDNLNDEQFKELTKIYDKLINSIR
ncbi:MAG: hypothetical protein HUJ57_06555 [Erysipelotrichaceae bacterium]|mgnify:FL=1|nr:hypothetical protein [Erysipelotrichaceae bacterium]